MEKNAKVVLLAVFILLIAIVSFSFNNITGQVTKKSSIVSVTPAVVEAGDIITITIKPGSYGVFSDYMWIYKKGAKYDTRVQGTARRICGKVQRCKNTAVVKYRTLGTWDPSEYYVRVWEADKNHFYENEYVQTKFTIVK